MHLNIVVSVLAFLSLTLAALNEGNSEDATSDKCKENKEKHSSEEWDVAEKALELVKKCDITIGNDPDKFIFDNMSLDYRREDIDGVVAYCHSTPNCEKSLVSPAFKKMGCDQTICPSKKGGKKTLVLCLAV
ncbi:hypothetical protein Moror_4490 [Moniliophthora roreri MCA 2997]|uniref:Uncharacterized protein n=1 Tax=Moniliophthora roreri (strain MCA 2997) TaxID=1381753 RepID=V2X003_MONRO|nr:hypothetical protein Moror_4490 [Moniliophthora roreri MCA 2997]